MGAGNIIASAALVWLILSDLLRIDGSETTVFNLDQVNDAAAHAGPFQRTEIRMAPDRQPGQRHSKKPLDLCPGTVLSRFRIPGMFGQKTGQPA